jgi:HK97 family phage prohead protease
MDTRKTKQTAERRDLNTTFEIRKADGQEGPGTLVGYAAVFDKWSEKLGWFREIIRSGAFADSLEAGADVRALVNHDTGRIIGRSSAKTLRIKEDDTGLKVEIDLPDTNDGRDLATSVERGDISGMSFGFEVLEDRWTHKEESADTDERELLKIDLFEVSAVPFPAYPDTSLAKRSFDRAQPEPKTLPLAVSESIGNHLKLKHRI